MPPTDLLPASYRLDIEIYNKYNILVRNIRKTLSYQLCGFLGCFAISIALNLFIDFLKEVKSSYISVPSENAFILTIIILGTAVVLTLFAFIDPSYRKDRDCDIMADIGYVMYIFIILISFNIKDILENQQLAKYFKKDTVQIRFIVGEIDKRNQDCIQNPNNIMGCMSKYLPKPQTQSNNTITIKDKTYIFKFQSTCDHPYNDSTRKCYIDIKDKKIKNNKYLRIYFVYNQDYRGKTLYQFSEELIRNNKTIEHIW